MLSVYRCVDSWAFNHFTFEGHYSFPPFLQRRRKDGAPKVFFLFVLLVGCFYFGLAVPNATLGGGGDEGIRFSADQHAGIGLHAGGVE